jgi:hypothetical protein
MSSVGANPPAGDRLYRSSDGGATWAEVLAARGPILDVALAPRSRVVVATLGGGAFVSDNGGAAFAAMPSPPQLACVGARDDGLLFGCAANWAPDAMALARSSDATTWDKVFRFVDLAGPLDCPAGTPQHDTCAAQWPAVRDQFGAVAPAGCPAPPVADRSSAPEPPPPATAPSARARSGGCCDAGPGSPGAAGVLAAVCGAALYRRRRR